jgi:hypothetical protein
MMKNRILLAAVMAAFSAPAFAGADFDLHVSTLGYGAGLAFQGTDSSVATRLGFNQFNKTYSSTSNGVNYEGKLKLSSADLLLDWHLFNGVTHLTAGLFYNNNKFDLTSVGSYTINGNTYTGTMNSTVTFKKVAPYLGFGWSGQPKKSGLSFKSDFGILFQGKPQSTVSSTDPAITSADLATAQAELDDKLKDFKYYPVISFAIGYAF